MAVKSNQATKKQKRQTSTQAAPLNIPVAIRPDNGKHRLPELEVEGPEYAESEIEPDEGNEKTTFSAGDEKDFASLEEQLVAGKRQVAEAYRTIRQRQLWKLKVDEQGNPFFSKFDEYCESHGHTRQWVTHLTNWLRITEELEQLGIEEQLSVRAAQALSSEHLEDAGGLRAVLEEAKEDGVSLNRDNLREIVVRRANYNDLSENGEAGIDQPAATSYAEYKADLATASKLVEATTDDAIVSRTKSLDGNFADNLVALCRDERCIPDVDHLLAMLTGEPLEEAVAAINEAIKHSSADQPKPKPGAARKKPSPSVTKSKPDTPALSIVPVESDSDEDEDESEESVSSRLRRSLGDVLKGLEVADALPLPDEDQPELQRTLAVGQECETTLDSITAKLKFLLGIDTEELTGVSEESE